MHGSGVQPGLTSSEPFSRRAVPYLLVLPSITIWDVANMSLHVVNRFGQFKGLASLITSLFLSRNRYFPVAFSEH